MEATNPTPTTTRQPVFRLSGDITFYAKVSGLAGGIKGDCIEVLRTLDDGKFTDLVLDPPYYTPGSNGSNRNIADFPKHTAKQFGDMLDLAIPHLSEFARVWLVFTEGKKASKPRDAFFAEVAKRFGLRDCCTYWKTYKDGRRCKIGDFPIPSQSIWLFNNHPDRNALGYCLPGSIELVRASRRYPTAKPPQLWERLFSCIPLSSASRVLDPYGGSGSTLVACNRMGIESLSIDVLHNPLDVVNQWHGGLL